jgi:hypothetical protein
MSYVTVGWRVYGTPKEEKTVKALSRIYHVRDAAETYLETAIKSGITDATLREINRVEHEQRR